MPVQATITRSTFTDNDSLNAARFNGVAAVSVLVPDATGSTEGVVRLAGDLTGSAASPQLAASGASPGTYGASGDSFPQITVDAKGRITSVANRDLPNTAVTPGTYGNSGLNVSQITVDAKGRATAASNRDITQAVKDALGNLAVRSGSTDVLSLLDDATIADMRNTLGLGNAATRNIGTTAGTACAGDDSRLNTFTPVQQGGGAGQAGNKVYVGWSGSELKVQVDNTDMGGVQFKNLAAVKVKAESGEYSVPGAYSNVDWAHGLGATPSIFAAYYRCKTAQYGYNVGDEVPVDNNSSSWHQIWANATNVSYRSNDANPAILRRDTTGAISMTPANWRLIFRAFL